ncbi:hypothetical protein Mapa_011933 [Marchantia paleacea]|nr:hypothetical protein Mapa_011933 [Marchantia paleacea]
MQTDLDVCCQRSWITWIQIPFVFWIVSLEDSGQSSIEAWRHLRGWKSERNQTRGGGGREGDREVTERGGGLESRCRPVLGQRFRVCQGTRSRR